MTSKSCLLLSAALAVAIVVVPEASGAPAEFEYRVVFASVRSLEKQLDEIGREGYACVSVARPDPGSGLPGVVVLVGRVAHASGPSATHRVIAGGRDDMQVPLTKAGADGFRLCGLVLDEEPPSPRVVAVMSHTHATWQYGAEVLLRYKESLVRLNTAARDGFVPVAAAPIDNNRVPDQRNWMVVTERTSTGASAREIAVRSDPGPTGLGKNLNESGKQGYHADLVWKEGNDFVAMMSRPSGTGQPPQAFDVDTGSTNLPHGLHHLPLGDFAYLSDRRLFVSDSAVSASNELVEETLPALGRAGLADARALGVIGDHISRNHGYEVAYAHVRREGGKFVLSTIITRKD